MSNCNDVDVCVLSTRHFYSWLMGAWLPIASRLSKVISEYFSKSIPYSQLTNYSCRNCMKRENNHAACEINVDTIYRYTECNLPKRICSPYFTFISLYVSLFLSGVPLSLFSAISEAYKHTFSLWNYSCTNSTWKRIDTKSLRLENED